ncbi:hypothetical protein [Pseudomonas huanghezhanensis]|uniref:hypothetical protein n=1 Tax=Pseudomonas huanghezhanensis TaxID=3002903 RepID=UPI0022861E0A|nr:hypothetical protein [Pseudomonas sp. BSw22131]
MGLCPDHQQHIIERLAIQKACNPGFGTDAFNKLLIQTFDDRPNLYPSTRSWVGIYSELEWISEISQRLCQLGRIDYLPSIVGYREFNAP